MNITYEDLTDLRELSNKPQYTKATHIRGVHKLGAKLGPAEIVYFGQNKVEEAGSTAMFICPKCMELFRCRTDLIISGNTKSCGCKQAAANQLKD